VIENEIAEMILAIAGIYLPKLHSLDPLLPAG
jgi:hypothetical protein